MPENGRNGGPSAVAGAAGRERVTDGTCRRARMAPPGGWSVPGVATEDAAGGTVVISGLLRLSSGSGVAVSAGGTATVS
jgi:hypothetical protein